MEEGEREMEEREMDRGGMREVGKEPKRYKWMGR